MKATLWAKREYAIPGAAKAPHGMANHWPGYAAGSALTITSTCAFHRTPNLVLCCLKCSPDQRARLAPAIKRYRHTATAYASRIKLRIRFDFRSRTDITANDMLCWQG